MSSVDATMVQARLRQLLPTVDMETATQRSITRRLEEDLGPLSAFKPLIKDEIDAFLTQQPASEGAEPEEASAGEDDVGAGAPPAAKRRRGAGGGAVAVALAAAAPSGSLPAALAGSFAVQLSAKRFASVRQFGGRWMVDVREFYEKEGALQPGAKGVALQGASWTALTGQLQALSQALEDGDDAFYHDLGSNKRASISNFKGRSGVDLREYYEKDGEMRPGKKGVALSADEWAQLCAAADEITQQLAAAGGGATSAAAAAAAPAAAAAAAAAALAAAPAAAAGAAGTAGGAAGGGLPVELSASRRADISEFKGNTYVGIREYYEKDGMQLPGKKGISLNNEQFGTLRQRAVDIDAALRRRDTSFEVPLSNKRKATINSFKGRYMVDMREYYEKDGQLAPGQKGISLPEEQWTRLVNGLPALAAALGMA